MNGYRVFDVAPVAAAHDDNDWHTPPRARAEDHFVTLRERRGGDPQAAQLVVFVRIRSGDVERDVETPGRKRSGQSLCNGSKVFAVGASVGQRDVERTVLFSKWKVVRAVHRKREYVGVVTKNCRRAVPLVDVRIENDGTRDSLLVDQPANCDRDIVEDAVTFAVIGVCVVRAAGEVDCKAVVERGARSAHRCADGPPRAFDHLRRPRKPDAPWFVRVETSFGNSPHVGGLMRQDELRIAGGRRFHQLMRRNDAGSDYALAEPAVLRHRETVSRRQRQDEMISVEDLHNARHVTLMDAVMRV
jgi:hypothetical protein